MGRAEEGEGARGSAIIVAAIGGGDGRDMLKCLKRNFNSVFLLKYNFKTFLIVKFKKRYY